MSRGFAFYSVIWAAIRIFRAVLGPPHNHFLFRGRSPKLSVGRGTIFMCLGFWESARYGEPVTSG